MDRYPSKWKKALLREVKKYPLIWHKKNDECWDAIHQSLNLPIEKSKLHKLWTYLRRYYKKLIWNKTLTQNNQVPLWEYFHDMCFLYESMKEALEKKTGLEVPKFLQTQLIKEVIFRCPCCVPREYSIYSRMTDEERNELSEQELRYYFSEEEESTPDSIEEEYYTEWPETCDLGMFEPIVCIELVDVDAKEETLSSDEKETDSDMFVF